MATTASGEPLSAGSRSRIGLILMLITIGILFRFAQLDRSFWFDEIATVVRIDVPSWFRVLTLSAADLQPPLYYSLAFVWGHVFGFSEVALRSLSLIAGLAALGTPWLARRSLSPSEKLLCLAVLALWVLPIRYAEEARNYSLLLLLSSACLFLYYDGIRSNGGVTGKGFYVCLALLALSHLFGLLLAESFLAVLWVRGRKWGTRLRLMVLAAVLIAVVLGPLLASGASQYAGGNFWIRFTPATVLKICASVITPAGALLLGYAAFAWRGSGPLDPTRAARTALLWSLAPFVLMVSGGVIISFHTPILTDRNLIALSPAISLFVAIALAPTLHTQHGWRVCGLLGLLAVQSAALLLSGRLFITEQFRGIAERSVTLGRKVCYVVPDRAPEWEYVMNFYIETRLQRPDLLPALVPRSALTEAGISSDCSLWADAHPDDPEFTLERLPEFQRCAPIPLTVPHERSASVLLDCSAGEK